MKIEITQEKNTIFLEEGLGWTAILNLTLKGITRYSRVLRSSNLMLDEEKSYCIEAEK